MPAISLRCRSCGHEQTLDAVGACSKCWGPLEPVYDLDELRIDADPGADRRRAAVAVALRRAPAGRDTGRAEAPAGPDAARSGSAARRGAWPARALPQAGHLQPDALLQGPRRRGRLRQGSGARAPDAGVLVDREPRGRGRGARRRRRARGRGLLPGRAGAGEAAADGGLRRDDLRGPRELRRLQPAHRRALLRAVHMGVRERRPPRLLRRGIEDARVRDRRAARLAASRRRRLPRRVGSAVLEARTRVRRVHRARARRGDAAQADRGPGRGLRPGRVGLSRGAAGDTRPAEHRRQLARDRQSRRRRPRAGDGERLRRLDPLRARGRDRPEHGLLAETPASSARRRPASASARFARRSSRDASPRTTASCCSSPATA